MLTRALVLSSIVATATPTLAANLSMCGPIAEVESTLRAHDETPLVTWLERDGSGRALFANPAGQWTLVMIDPGRGVACTMRDGVGLTEIPKE